MGDERDGSSLYKSLLLSCSLCLPALSSILVSFFFLSFPSWEYIKIKYWTKLWKFFKNYKVYRGVRLKCVSCLQWHVTMETVDANTHVMTPTQDQCVAATRSMPCTQTARPASVSDKALSFPVIFTHVPLSSHCCVTLTSVVWCGRSPWHRWHARNRVWLRGCELLKGSIHPALAYLSMFKHQIGKTHP